MLQGLTKSRQSDYILSEVGQRTYESFFEPLMRSKFGAISDKVSAAWLIGRIAIRSNRGLSGERLGYLKGGFQVFLDALTDEVGRDCTIRLYDPVTDDITEIGRVAGKWTAV